jgi:3-oxochol-4-en-24-oyl-CoA dehydrogenase
VPIATTEEQRAWCASLREWAKSVGPIGLVRQLEPGDPAVPRAAAGRSPASAPGTGCQPAPPNQDYWLGLADLGVFSIALPTAVAGAGGTVADLAAALEQLTYSLIPGPVVPTMHGSLLLAACWICGPRWRRWTGSTRPARLRCGNWSGSRTGRRWPRRR